MISHLHNTLVVHTRQLIIIYQKKKTRKKNNFSFLFYYSNGRCGWWKGILFSFVYSRCNNIERFFIIWIEKIPRRNCWLVVVVAPIEMIGVGSRPHTNFYFDLPADDLLGFWCDFSLYTSCRKWNSWWQSHDFFSFFFFLFSFESWYRNISFQLFWIGFIMNSKKWTKQIWIIGQSIRECDFGSFRRPYRQRGIKLTSTNSWVYY